MAEQPTGKRKQITIRIADETGLSQLEVGRVVQRTLELIVETIATEGRIELRGFGVFEVRVRKARMARNPRTNTPVHVPAKSVVVFEPGTETRAACADWAPTEVPTTPPEGV